MRYSLLFAWISACTLAAQSNAGAGSIEGHVFNSLTGAPLRKAMVRLADQRNAATQVYLNAETDAAGKFQFTGLPPGTYGLSAWRPGFSERRARRVLSLSSDDHVADAEIRLPPQGVISGRILDEVDEPEPDAAVFVFKQVYRNGRKQWEQLNRCHANDAGEYRVPNLAPGRYLLQAYVGRPAPDNHYGDVDSPANPGYFPVYYQGASTQREALPVDVGVGAEVRGIDFRLFKIARPPSVHVRGRITGMPPGSTISVSLVPVVESLFGGGSTMASSPDYAFDLAVPPSQYTIHANVSSGGPDAYGIESLNVTGDVAGVVVAMSPAPEISGRISLAESGSKVSLQGVKVTLNAPYQLGNQEVRSDATGKFVFTEPFSPARYTMNVDARSIPDGCFIREIKLGGQEISPDDFEILASTQLELVLSSTAGTIGGSVLDADGKPFPNAIVTLIPPDGKSRPVKQSVDTDGNFRFTGLRPGKYKLFAWEQVDNDLWPDQEFRKKYEDRATEITVGPSETQTAQLRVIVAEEMK
jgi:protocatechuate 3,4-dioxygenase beta subunit